jgi:Fe-S-cluster containining protein
MNIAGDKENGVVSNQRNLLAGLVYTHNRANANTVEVYQACATVYALVELLLERGVLDREELAQPYMLAHAADGYCMHMVRETHGCTIYEKRPVSCRGYDCREDRCIWLDFDNGVINPRINEPDWPVDLES